MFDYREILGTISLHQHEIDYRAAGTAVETMVRKRGASNLIGFLESHAKQALAIFEGGAMNYHPLVREAIAIAMHKAYAVCDYRRLDERKTLAIHLGAHYALTMNRSFYYRRLKQAAAAMEVESKKGLDNS